MAKAKTEQYKQEILDVIRSKKIAFYDHVFAYTSFSSSTAYNHELEKVEDIKEALKKNRVSYKAYMLEKWVKSDNATLQVAAMRLLSDTEEHRKLNQNYTDHTTDGKAFPAPTIVIPKGE